MCRHWLLLLAIFGVAYGITVQPHKSCLDNCKCSTVYAGSFSVNILRVVSCNGPLVLNKTTFEKINPTKIVAVSFENIIIDQIQEDAFSGMKILEDAVFRKCHIGSIDQKTFNNVKKVNFADCRFEDRPDFFSEKMEELHFGNCQLTEIPKLNRLLRLTFLNLSGNLIKDLEIDTFAELFDLTDLHLTYNEIFKIPPTLFINNRNLNALYLDNNPLKEFQLNTTEELTILSLKNCQLEKFDEKSSQRLHQVTQLNLSNNKIRTISRKAFNSMKELVSIHLSHNKLTALNDDIFSGNPKLARIVLDDNSFQTLPNFYLENGDKFILKHLSCNFCGLKSLLPSVFRNMSVITLDLSHNQLRQVDGIFDKMTALEQLDISYNNITEFNNRTFKNNGDLFKLNIAGNPLGVLDPEVFSENEVLSEIDARNASLKKLWSKTNVRLNNLEKILLGSNNLTTLTAADFDVMPALEGIDINRNPLMYTSELCNVFESLERKNGKDLLMLETKDNYSYGGNLEEDTNGFVTSEWSSFLADKCYLEGEDDYDDEGDFGYTDDETNDDTETDDYNDVETKESKPLRDEVRENFASASYILSITSVFLLSALVVLTIAVTLTLCLLKRNADMQGAELPRFKIPLWTTGSGQKKHSGSVYRALSEEISCPRTPKFNRYEFTSTPTVHSSNP